MGLQMIQRILIWESLKEQRRDWFYAKLILWIMRVWKRPSMGAMEFSTLLLLSPMIQWVLISVFPEEKRKKKIRNFIFGALVVGVSNDNHSHQQSWKWSLCTSQWYSGIVLVTKQSDDCICWFLKEEMVEPAVNGTKNVIIAAAEAKVRRVVFTSSIGAVYMDPNRSPDQVVDESCWSDLEFCKNTKVFPPTFFSLTLFTPNFHHFCQHFRFFFNL